LTEGIAIVQCAMRNKMQLAALRVKDFGKRDVTVIHTLLRPDEIRDPDFPVLGRTKDVGPAFRARGQCEGASLRQ
jgi:DNA end-binding protein Ku